MTKTDHALFELFQKNPDLIKLLNPSKEDTHYTMRAEELKEVARRLDAIFIPDDTSEPLIHLELQGYPDENIYHRALSGAGMLGPQYPDYEVHVIILFISPGDDPKTPPWYEISRSHLPGLSVIYLPTLLDELRQEEEPDPVLPLLSLLVKNTRQIKETARQDFELLQNASLSPPIKENYVKIFMYWLMQMLKDMDEQEVLDMIGILTPLEETKAYQGIAKRVGIKYEQRLKEQEEALHKKDEALYSAWENQVNREKDNIQRFKLLLKQGNISKEQFIQITEPIKKEMSSLRQKLRELKKRR